MTQTNIKISGFGGQGVLLGGVILGNSAMKQGKYVTWMPSYGSEMRGGTANCSVIISDDEISSPFTPKLDILIAMNKPSVDKFIDELKPDGIILLNRTLTGDIDSHVNRKVAKINATEIAIGIGDSRVANMVMLGALIRTAGILEKDNVQKVIAEYFEGKGKIADLNTKAFNKGYELVDVCLG